MRFLGKLRRRNKGVGSIIGAVFIVLILISGFTFYASYLNTTNHYNETTGTMDNRSQSQNQERIIIKQISISSTNNLSLTVENQGTVNSHLIWLGLFNKSAVPESQVYYPLDYSLNPSEALNLTSNFIIVQGQKYVVQLVTELGNVVQSVFYPASAVHCALSLTVASPTTYSGNNVTVMLTITLNDTEVDVVQNITASISASPTGLVALVGNSPPTITGLAQGESVFFWWVFNTISTGTVTFNATYSSAPVGSYALTTVNILSAQGGGGGNVVVSGINGTGEFNPSQMNPLGGTQNVNGSVGALSASDSNYAVFSSYYTGSTVDINDSVDNNVSNVDSSANRGTHSNFPAMQTGPDSTYDTLTETSGSTTPAPYNPYIYNLLGSTTLVSGTTAALAADDGTYLAFRSYQTASSSQSLYAHSETATISGTPFYLNKLDNAEQTGTSFSASMGTTGRQLFGKFVYPLTAVSSIPASTWTMNYRTWADAGQTVNFDSSNSGNAKASATVSWSHTTGSGSNRIMVVGVSIRTASVSVLGITYGDQSLTFIRADTRTTTVKSQLWYLVAPALGTATVTVTLSGSSDAVGGSSTFSGVNQALPLDANTGLTGSSTAPSQSITVNTPNSMLVGHLAISGSTATVSSEGSGQTMLWDDFSQTGAASTRCRGHGSREGPDATGSQTMSWSLSASANWAVSIVALKPANSVGHVDIDVLIRKADGTVRATIASEVASSTNLGTTAATLSATYSWGSYTVVDQTDYLEIDYYANVTAAGASINAYLRIDDNSLAAASQTRADNIMLPSQYTVAVEFIGSSDTQSWSQLAWMVDSSFTTAGVTATFQLYNYIAGAYSTIGDGFITDTIGTANITETQIITINPTQFRDASGNWKLKITGIKTTTIQFDWQADFLKYEEVPIATYGIDLEVQWTNVDYNEANEELCIYGGASENNTFSLNAIGGYMIIGSGDVNWGSSAGTISFWIKWADVSGRPWGQHDNMETRFSGSNLVLDWGGDNSLTSSTSFVAGNWYFIALAWNENTNALRLYVGDQTSAPALDAQNTAWFSAVSTVGVTQNNFLASKGGIEPTNGKGDELRYWNVERPLSAIQSDYNVQLTGSEITLSSYFKLNNNFNDVGPTNNTGSSYGISAFSSDVPIFGLSAESIRVDVWNGVAWQNVFTNLASGWNNVSVSSYLTSSTFTIRFKDALNDTVQDSWGIDVALLHLWATTDQYTAQVEFSGSSNLQNWTSVLWQIQSCWDISQVSVSIQLYNFTLGDYAASGNGYLSYTSSATPDFNELRSKIETLNPGDFKNATGYWKIKVTGVKSTSTQFLMKIDWIDMQTTYSTTGDTIPYNTWQYYSINATTTSGNPILYAYVSLYHTPGTSITMVNATNFLLNNPDYVHLDVNGTYVLRVNSASVISQTFVIYAVVGSVVGQKTVTQVRP